MQFSSGLVEIDTPRTFPRETLLPYSSKFPGYLFEKLITKYIQSFNFSMLWSEFFKSLPSNTGLTWPMISMINKPSMNSKQFTMLESSSSSIQCTGRCLTNRWNCNNNFSDCTDVLVLGVEVDNTGNEDERVHLWMADSSWSNPSYEPNSYPTVYPTL